MHINFYFSQIDGKKWKLIGETKNPLAESLREKKKRERDRRFSIFTGSVSLPTVVLNQKWMDALAAELYCVTIVLCLCFNIKPNSRRF